MVLCDSFGLWSSKWSCYACDSAAQAHPKRDETRHKGRLYHPTWARSPSWPSSSFIIFIRWIQPANFIPQLRPVGIAFHRTCWPFSDFIHAKRHTFTESSSTGCWATRLETNCIWCLNLWSGNKYQIPKNTPNQVTWVKQLQLFPGQDFWAGHGTTTAHQGQPLLLLLGRFCFDLLLSTTNMGDDQWLWLPF